MNRFYKKIETSIELKAYDDAAVAVGAQAVGISASGALYKWDRHGKRVEKITSSEALEILKVNPDQLEKIIETRGTYEIEEPVIETPVIETHVIETPVDVGPEQAPVIESSLTEHVKVDNTLVDDLKKTVAEIYTIVCEIRDGVKADHADLKAAVDELSKTVKVIKDSFILE